MPTPVVTFDAGQTFIELDLDFLASRLGERGISVEPTALGQAVPRAWAVHDQRVAAGAQHPWRALMSAILEGAGIEEPYDLTEWLWSEQPRKNLWRKEIPEMVTLARELRADGVRVAVLSNSEGYLAELLEEIGILDAFETVIDSGVFGIAKPDRRIFDHALERLGVRDTTAIHIGDSFAADVTGALEAGWNAIWFGPTARDIGEPRVLIARTAEETRAALRAFGLGG